MSTTQKTTAPSSNFISIFETDSKEYNKLTRQDLQTHPFAAVLENCQSPDAILAIFRKQANAFDEFRKGDDRIMQWLDPIVHILFTFSATLGEGIGLPFSPGKVIFAGIGVLLAAAKDVITSHDTLANLFERIDNFLQRLKIYLGIPLTPQFTELLGKIMAQVLFILALSTKAMTQRRIKKYLKKLVGRTEVEDALQRLDTLTQEENRMGVARNLEVTHGVDRKVKVIEETAEEVDGNVKAVKEIVEDVNKDTRVSRGSCMRWMGR
ncbi:hypothetical protein B0F90DRAFT_403677 [Multifurca ochricompacta]|uniref:Fungal STAND N-terminal Goodbye domain-containing protein n=1 Tax=Multifurca ochricompacta TaxID=376703 RepID=A0AAD4QEZ4_9AGAM|nr:hypothetical protein B0F90DRAFT_403677 [Multifurca ochricompacta]